MPLAPSLAQRTEGRVGPVPRNRWRRGTPVSITVNNGSEFYSSHRDWEESSYGLVAHRLAARGAAPDSAEPTVGTSKLLEFLN